MQDFTLLRTDQNGLIEVVTDGERMWVEVEKKQKDLCRRSNTSSPHLRSTMGYPVFLIQRVYFLRRNKKAIVRTLEGHAGRSDWEFYFYSY
jgi:hypothetical protein